jgi:hypothetical protein
VKLAFDGESVMASRFVADGLLSKAKEEVQQRAMLDRIEKLERLQTPRCRWRAK